MKNHYETLGLKRDAKKQQIKKAYHKLALQWHPDKNTQRAQAIEQFHSISEAYNTLSNNDLKEQYDDKLEKRDYITELSNFMKDFEKQDYYHTQTPYNTYLSQEDQEVLNNFKNRIDHQAQKSKHIRKR